MLTEVSSTVALALCHRRQDSPGTGGGGGVAQRKSRSKGRFRRALGSAWPGVQEGSNVSRVNL
jgi:hypothetical protein